MHNPTFTTDPKRIARLERNFQEGKARESLSKGERDALDREAFNVGQDRVKELFKNATEHRAAAIAARRSAY